MKNHLNIENSIPARFKETLASKPDVSCLEPAEAQALLEALEMLGIQDGVAYTEAKKRLQDSKPDPDFTEVVAEQVYYHPRVYANEQEGFAFVAAWYPLVAKGFYPDEKSAAKLVEFLYFGLAFLQSEAISEESRLRIFEVLRILIHSKSKASVLVAQFLMHRALDMRDYLSAHFIIQYCLNYELITGIYFAADEQGILQEYPFRISDDFVMHFYKGKWELLVESLHQVLPVGQVGKPGAYEVLKPWLSEDLARFYAKNEQWVAAAHKVLVERVLFVEDESFDYINLRTSEGEYPLVTGLNSKQWDESDVLLFSIKDKNIPLKQTEPGFYRLQDWLLAADATHFNRPVFDDYGKIAFQVNSAKELPVRSILLWFVMSDAKSSTLSKIAFFNDVFSCLLTGWEVKQLPVMSHKGEDFPVTGVYVLRDLFETSTQLENWIPSFQPSGLADPLNQFLILCFYDARFQLNELLSDESKEALYNHLITLAHSARESKPYLRETGVQLIVETLIVLYKDTPKVGRVNEISALKNLHPSIIETCEQYAKSYYVNTETPLEPQFIQSWYLSLNDYYYSSGKELVWVAEVLKNQGERLAQYFNEVKAQEILANEVLFRLLTFLKRSTKNSKKYPGLEKIASEITTHLSDLLQHLKHGILFKNTVETFHSYLTGHEINLYHQMQLEPVIMPFYRYYFEQGDTRNVAESQNTNRVTPLVTSAIKLSDVVLEQVITDLENFKESRIDSVVYRTFLEKNLTDIQSLLAKNTPLAMQFYQALYLIIIDVEAGPDGIYKAYGNLVRSVFVQFLKGTAMAQTYGQGLQMMAESGAYSENLTETLLQVVTDLKA
ncbi:hypothetical protein [Leeuwenhoekiella marinoflava]|uniref:hypothetical protein n=1 Tax=Leeuwenhoekiella marinoflava TaxID=988 RepID=UPI003003697C